MQIRFHASDVHGSMLTLEVIPNTHEAVFEYLKRMSIRWHIGFVPEDIVVKPYWLKPDPRVSFDVTNMVLVRGEPVAFCDELLDDDAAPWNPLNFGGKSMAPIALPVPVVRENGEPSLPVTPGRELGVHSIPGEGGFVFSHGIQNPDYLVLIPKGAQYLFEFAGFGYARRTELVGKTYISSDGTVLTVEVVSTKEALLEIANRVGVSIEQLWCQNNNWYVIYKPT